MHCMSVIIQQAEEDGWLDSTLGGASLHSCNTDCFQNCSRVFAAEVDPSDTCCGSGRAGAAALTAVVALRA